MRSPLFLCGCSLLLTLATASITAQTPDSAITLYREFRDPPRDFSPMPFWFWNGEMKGPVIQQEIRDMVAQHVYGAFLHGRDGLKTPYLSNQWFDAIRAGLEQAKRSGFEFNFVDEYDWPSGEVRNVWMPGNHQSEILARRPDLRMKTLAYDATVVAGPKPVDLPLQPDTQAAVAARWLGKNQIDASTLTLLDTASANGHLAWSAPDGQWVIVQFHLEPAMGFDGGFVDLLNPDATQLFFKLVYGEYYRRFSSYFGSTMRYSFSDHEGDYGYRIAWTPKLFAAFQQRNGYDLRRMLPLLIYSGGDPTPKLRNDYLATISDLYQASFWQGITSSAGSLGLGRSGHAWEESLQWAAALEGSLFSVERGLNPVGVDSLFDYGRQPLNFKVAQSVADYEGRRFACENQGVQGTDSYLDLEKMRMGTNGIAAFGVNLFIPHAFNYDASRANYPPDWLHQPFWPWFHTYADYTRRLSFMNADSQHVVNVLLYYPIATMWSDTGPLFSGSADYQQIGRPVAWKNQTILINDYYTRILLQLTNHHWDYNIADDQYLQSARIEGNELVIGPQRFRAIILPPISTLSRATLSKLLAFHRAGGILLGIRLLPSASPEAGGHDPEIASGIASIFGAPATQGHTTGESVTASGDNHSFYITDSVDDLIATLDAHVRKDVRVTSGPAQHLLFEHRLKQQTDYYWVANDSDRQRINQVHFAVRGIPEKWDALGGARQPLFYANDATGTTVRLVLAPWDGFYVVFHPLTGPGQNLLLTATNAEQIYPLTRNGDTLTVRVVSPVTSSGIFVTLADGARVFHARTTTSTLRPFVLEGSWQFQPQLARISVPYAKSRIDLTSSGESLGWAAPGFDDANWPDTWLSEEQTTVRKWQLIGPFPNAENAGFAKAYPPEQTFDPQQQYEGLHGPVGWQPYDANEPYLALNSWSIWMKTEGGRGSDSSYIVNFNPAELTDSLHWIASYAHTYLYSPIDQQAQFIVAADNWARVWLNHHEVFSQLRTPFWYELNDQWADRIPVDLHKGWNEVLLKIGKGRGTASGYFGFLFRVADAQGSTLANVIAATSPRAIDPATDSTPAMRWYRIQIPPGCVAVVPPALHHPFRMMLNGHTLPAAQADPIDFRSMLRGETNTLVLSAREDDPLVSPIVFVTGPTPFALQSWTTTGLANFSGSAIYTKSFTLPQNLQGQRLMLDLGQVSSVAEVYVNDVSAGALVWSPYRVDITKLLKPGVNQIRLIVTNTEANQRAVGAWRHILSAIDRDGLEGPVQIIPYVDEALTLNSTQHPAIAQTSTSAVQ